MSTIKHETLAFPDTWRLLSFGKWKFHRELRQEPVIQVTLGEIYGAGVEPSKAPRLTGQIRDCELPVGELPPLYLNAILSDGKVLPAQNLAPPTENRLKHPETLDFSRTNCRIITREHQDETGNVVIPRRRKLFELRGDRESLFLAIGKGSDPYARIVPCMEIVRFFYASSTGMARAVFSEAFTRPDETLWNPARCDWDRQRGHVHIHLRKSRMDADARLLAYFYTQPVAFKHAASIFKQVAVSAAAPGAGGAHAVQAYAPLDGKAPARYRYIPIGVGGRDRRLITRFHTVDLPVAFRSLEWTRDGDSRSTPDRRYVPVTPGKPSAPRIDDDTLPEEYTFTDEAQNREQSPRHIVFHETEGRFRTLSAVPAKKSEKHTQQFRSQSNRKSQPDSGAATTLAASGGDPGRRRISLQNERTEEDSTQETDTQQNSDDPFDNLVKQLQALGILVGVKVEFLGLLGRQFWEGSVVYNAFEAKYAWEKRHAPHVGAWYFSDDAGAPRLLVAAEIRVKSPSGDQFYYVVDMQARKGRREGIRLLCRPGFAQIDSGVLARALRNEPRHQALRIKLEGVNIQSQRHVWPFGRDARPKQFLKAVIQKLGDAPP
ncbi:hypothetical protein [Natronospira bacteriovora]|uniref:TnsE C-terminal domain-containing protein n=1 Tax=Natronospira bacteriovora TaxID=3069753 RepID=A0ABU0W722_9GAMM|nr:hypothetical protein [Natronospira sp. AB-CW4]MDQ2069832.1 hypothetical protein [Natronospira sp. AB-CW4]